MRRLARRLVCTGLRTLAKTHIRYPFYTHTKLAVLAAASCLSNHVALQVRHCHCALIRHKIINNNNYNDLFEPFSVSILDSAVHVLVELQYGYKMNGT